MRLLLSVYFWIWSNALAAPFCHPSRSQIIGDRSLISKVFEYDAPDRRTKAQYAKENNISTSEVDRRYGASGDFNCGDSWSQGQVVAKDNLILVSAHALGYWDKCEKPLRPLEKCRFYVEVNGNRVAYEVESEVDTVMKCPRDKDLQLEPDDDWAVLKLKKSVDPSIKPYKVSTTPMGNENPTLKGVVFVAKSKDYNPAKASRIPDYARHYGNCAGRAFFGGSYAAQIQSDCDMDHFASGGGMFLPGPEPVLVGIAENRGGDCSDGTGKNGKGKWQKGCWGSRMVGINNRILKALE